MSIKISFHSMLLRGLIYEKSLDECLALSKHTVLLNIVITLTSPGGIYIGYTMETERNGESGNWV